MAKIFRKIRLNQISEGNVRPYLIYAFGEIILVVIGIIIALQINNWNERRKIQIEHAITLQKMYRDLQSDSLSIQICLEAFERNYERGILLWKQLYEDASIPLSQTEFIIETQSVGRAAVLDINDNQFLSLSNNNRLKLILDEQLRADIILYYSDQFSTHMFELLQERNIEFNDIIVAAIPLFAHLNIIQGNYDELESWVANKEGLSSDILQQLKENKELPLALKNTLRSYLLTQRVLERLAILNQEIRNKIQASH